MNSIGFSCCRINIVNENGKRGMGKQKMEKFDEMGKKCGKRIDDKKM
jgi:hypothetical protein